MVPSILLASRRGDQKISDLIFVQSLDAVRINHPYRIAIAVGVNVHPTIQPSRISRI